jgi:hypothetical protein
MKYLLILVFLIPAQASAVESFGRFFTTPAERANLNHLRQTRKIEPVTENQPGEAVESIEPAMPPSVSVQGYIKRSDGKKGTVWINEKPVQEESATGEIQVGKIPNNGNEVQIKLPATGKNFQLKAGQIYDPQTDAIKERTSESGRVEAGSIGIQGEKPN